MLSINSLAADLFVATNGNDANAGTQTSPLRTIQKASALAQPGTNIHVQAGTYLENPRTLKSGTKDLPIRYLSEGKWTAKIIGSGTEATWLNTGNYVEINGFDVSGTGRLGIQNNGSFVLIQNNHVHDMEVSGGCTGSGGAGIVNANYSASDDDIIGNVVHDIGTPGACNGVQGIYHANLRGHVHNNVVYRVSSFGIHLWHAATEVSILNNTVFQNGSSRMGGGIVIGSGDAPGGIVVDKTTIANNIVYQNPAGGIVEYCYAGVNCIGDNILISNNLVFGNGYAFSLKKGSAIATVVADPLLANVATADYHLLANSPAIDRGLASSEITVDIDGNKRVGAIDIGASEYIPAVVVQKNPIQLSTTKLWLGRVAVGKISAIKFVTITNVGTVPFKIPKAFVMTGNFSFGGKGTCNISTEYKPGQSCTASVVFKPTAKGLRTGTLTMTTNLSATPMVVNLAGTGL